MRLLTVEEMFAEGSFGIPELIRQRATAVMEESMTVQLICCSHSPLMTTDVEESEANVHAEFFRELDVAASALHAFDPDLVVVFGPRPFQRLLLRPDAGVLHRHRGRRLEGLASRERAAAGAARARDVLRALSARARFRRRDLAPDEGRPRHHHSAVQAHRRARALRCAAGLRELRGRPAPVLSPGARLRRGSGRVPRRPRHARDHRRLRRAVA